MLETVLNTAPYNPLFSNFPKPSTITLTVPSKFQTTASAMQPLTVHAGGVSISAPAVGHTVRAGEVVSVAVASDVGFNTHRVLVAGREVAASDRSAPFEVGLRIPADALGPFPIIAVGTDGQTFYTSDPVTLTVVTTSTLTGLRVTPEERWLLGTGKTSQIHVTGIFDDGVERDVSSGAAGTVYTSAQPWIATVSPDGAVTSLGTGETTITIRNGQFEASVLVIVDTTNYGPLADAGQDQDVLTGTLVTLDGTGTIDLDDPYESLTFTWSQLGGPAVTLDDLSSDRPSFTADRFGLFTFGLVVRDEEAVSQQATVHIRVVTPSTTNVYLPLALRRFP
jgi:hypothetical protein